jgi:hypothetical protein
VSRPWAAAAVGLVTGGLWDCGYAACSAFQNARIRAE